MGGRNAQPVELIKANGRSHHLTKAIVAERKKAEIKTGTNVLRCPDFVKKDMAAYKKWKEIIRVYKDAAFVSSGDIGLLARYCMSFSEYENLLDSRSQLNHIDINWDQYDDIVPLEFADSINRLLKLGPLLQIDTAINKKMDMLIKMEDRLFLNPLAKVKNVPKQTHEKVDPLKSRFGDI